MDILEEFVLWAIRGRSDFSRSLKEGVEICNRVYELLNLLPFDTYFLLAAVVIRVKMVAKTPCFIIGALPQTPHSP